MSCWLSFNNYNAEFGTELSIECDFIIARIRDVNIEDYCTLIMRSAKTIYQEEEETIKWITIIDRNPSKLRKTQVFILQLFAE